MPLIVFEGLQGSGKSTAISLLESLLNKLGKSYCVTSWNSTNEINPIVQNLKLKKKNNPIIMALLHASDFLLRYEYDIKPNLSKNNIVIADRYIYTSYVRDCARDVPAELLDYIYKEVIEPDIVFYMNVSIETACARKIKEIDKNNLYEYYYYNSGMDITGLDLQNSMKVYKQNLKLRYDNIFLNKKNVVYIDAELSVEEIDKIINSYVLSIIDNEQGE